MQFFASLLLGLLPLQEPSDDLQKALAMDSSATRYRAALEVAAAGSEVEEWLLDEVGNGTRERQRALLLACALMGTERTLAELEVAARRGTRSKPDPERAYALLLYGAYHPAAGKDAKKDWERARSDYERACLLVGLLGQRGALFSDDWGRLCGKSKVAELMAIQEVGVLLDGGPASPLGAGEADPVLLSARMLASVIPGAVPIGEATLQMGEAQVPELWLAAARRESPRDALELRTLPAASTGAAAGLALFEVSEEERQAIFDHFHPRIRDASARAWLFGAAGELGLEFPLPLDPEKLDAGEIAGLLCLARESPDAAAKAARDRLPAARKVFADRSERADRWSAALTIALADSDGRGRSDADARRGDLDLLRAWVESATGEEKLRLWPVWNLARGSLADPGTREHWYRIWARGLGAGPQGYLDIEGPRWAAYLLVGGTQAADERLHLVARFPGLELDARDYSADHNVYRDIADFLSGSYRFGLPN